MISFNSALSVLLSTNPASFVGDAIDPEELSIPMLFVVYVVADILTSVGPDEDTLAVHFVVLPMAAVGASVLPTVLAVAFDVVSNELTAID
jgi:hypothetical protein